jgi:eukaryotic-like serine/threonine-protein kinase
MSTPGAKLGSLQLAIGDVVAGKYRLERMLGEGGTGLVVLARHVTLGQPVAIKFLRPALATNEVILRFEREARAISRLESEYIVAVLDVGQLPDGDPFMVMEHLEGQDLACVIKERRLSPEAAVDCMVQVCEALREAHASGVIHRDLKPANLFLTQSSDGVPHVKVVDFGISKVTDPRMLGKNVSDVTNASTVLGSPRYMAPEQLRSSRDVDARCDVWSVGAVLYQLLSGRLAFDGETNVQASMRVLTSDATPLGQVAPQLPPELCRAVDRCLERDLGRRWGSVAELQDALLPFASERTRDMLLDHRDARGAPNVNLAFEAASVGDQSLVPSSARPRVLPTPALPYPAIPAPVMPPMPPHPPAWGTGRMLEPTPIPVVLRPDAGGRPMSLVAKAALVVVGLAFALSAVAAVLVVGRARHSVASAAEERPADEPMTVSLDAGDSSP